MPARRRLVVSDSLRDFLRHLPPALKRKVRFALDEIVASPAAGLALRGRLTGLHRYRVGRLRIIYRLRPDGDIDLVAVGPRRTIYGELVRQRPAAND